ncbi:MAG: molybdopterin molybdenumtransferase MoeA [Chloroflexi bacterium]|nr:molybdopterin molybdenumtransferase MoeA [Chloroflexota bacterium]
MLTVEEALRRILATVQPLHTENVGLHEALGRVLGVEVQASYDLPPFDNSSMDGFAVIAADVAGSSTSNPVTLQVIEDIPAGKAPQMTVGHGQAARIMTGAPMPAGADAVVPVEQTDQNRLSPETPASIKVLHGVQKGDYVRPVGEDIQRGETVLERGQVLRPADLGVLAGLGVSQVEVVARPKVAVISNGDELVLPHEPLTPGKIRDMNSYFLPALIQEAGGEPLLLGIARDTVESVREKLTIAVEQGANLILSSAGVSVGAFDVVKTVLDEMGSVEFWKVNLRPGKPLTFGQIQGICFIGLPGNPVSAMVTFDVFARPVIRKMLGLSVEMPTRMAKMGEAMTSDGRMTFARVRLSRENGDLVAYSTGNQSSGAISSMVKADGLLIIPEGVREVKIGDRLAVRPFRFED